MSNTNNGGPAFPRNYNSDGHNGMTLRDHFAGLAMQGFLSNVEASDNITEVPRVCYLLADAMLKAREA